VAFLQNLIFGSFGVNNLKTAGRRKNAYQAKAHPWHVLCRTASVRSSENVSAAPQPPETDGTSTLPIAATGTPELA